LLLLAFSSPTGHPFVKLSDLDGLTTGQELYEAACAACHGIDGTGEPQSKLGFDVPPPDFTECSFASREPAADWVAVAHDGGPTRAFSRLMPAFGDALSMEQLELIMEYVGGMCTEKKWPRGELNLPRPLVTEKAYPEDEAVITSTIAAEGSGSVMNKFVYERRFGSRSQIEIIVPFGVQELSSGSGSEWTSGVGDIALGLKHALLHSASSGSILSVAGEIILPTGNEDDHFGKGVTIFEPFASFGQILPADMFFQAQAGLEFPFDTDKADNEAFWRAALGKSFAQGGWGRTWSPMVEILASRDLEDDAVTKWDIVPQFQVTLNQRQHIMGSVGVRLPINETDHRNSMVMVYLLWDWFDGGFLEGW
jgi:mono/diheme cytochrome c family protein